MLKISAQGLRDFQVCERYYDYKFNDKLEVKKDIRYKRIDNFGHSIRLTANFFFYKKQAFSEPSYSALENRWERLWFKEGTTAADIASARNEILWESNISYATQASVALMNFHEYFANNPKMEVMMIDEAFTVPISNEVAIEGVFDVVLREEISKGQYKYHVYKWVTDNLKKPITFWSFDFAMLAYAFRYRNRSYTNVDYYIWDFGSTVPKAKKLELEEDDIDSMLYWCKTLAKTENFIPKRGLTPYCKSCVFDRPCSKWSFKEVKA